MLNGQSSGQRAKAKLEALYIYLSRHNQQTKSMGACIDCKQYIWWKTSGACSGLGQGLTYWGVNKDFLSSCRWCLESCWIERCFFQVHAVTDWSVLYHPLEWPEKHFFGQFRIYCTIQEVVLFILRESGFIHIFIPCFKSSKNGCRLTRLI